MIVEVFWLELPREFACCSLEAHGDGQIAPVVVLSEEGWLREDLPGLRGNVLLFFEHSGDVGLRQGFLFLWGKRRGV